MAVSARRRRTAVFLFSLVAAVPFAVTLWNLRLEARIARVVAGPNLIITGTVERAGQREQDGQRAVYAEYTWSRGGRDYRGTSRLNIPDIVKPGPGEKITLYMDLADPSFAVPVKLHREPARLARLELLCALFTLPPLALWALLGWSLWRERRDARERESG